MLLRKRNLGQKQTAFKWQSSAVILQTVSAPDNKGCVCILLFESPDVLSCVWVKKINFQGLILSPEVLKIVTYLSERWEREHTYWAFDVLRQVACQRTEQGFKMMHERCVTHESGGSEAGSMTERRYAQWSHCRRKKLNMQRRLK